MTSGENGRTKWPKNGVGIVEIAGVLWLRSVGSELFLNSIYWMLFMTCTEFEVSYVFFVPAGEIRSFMGVRRALMLSLSLSHSLSLSLSM